MTFKFNLRDWAYIRNLSIPELATKSGVSERSIQKYVSNINVLQQAKYSTIKKIANALNIKVEDIFLDPSSEKQKNLKKELSKIAQ